MGNVVMNIFNSLPIYAQKWQETSRRSLNDEEKSAIRDAETVSSQYGISVKFNLLSGGVAYIPMSQNSSLGVGEPVDLEKVSLLTLSRQGDDDIIRVEV